jgi:beta-glucosidase-like glycosyl hydrolase
MHLKQRILVLSLAASFGFAFAGARLPHGAACLTPATASLPFCDPSQPTAARIADLVSRLTVSEKIGLLGTLPNSDTCAGLDAGVPRLDIPALSNLIECTGSVSSNCFVDTDGSYSCPTVFPSPLAVAASFNRSLMRLRGAVTGMEARAFNNLHVNRIGGNPVDLLAFGPDLNVIVDPRNGRNGENPSEDPFLAAIYAEEYVRGAQESDDDPSHLQLAMSLKHFAGYQAETNRFGSNFNFSLFDLVDTYLPPFARGFSKGNAVGTMCSYNSLNGIPACADAWLLREMPTFWGRPEAVHMSDCGAVENQYEQKHTAASYADATAQSIKAGTDWCMGTAFTTKNGLSDALAQGLITPADLDAALARTLSLRFRLGIFDAPPRASPLTAYGAERIGAASSRQAAEGAAAQGAVLLRNDGGVLPLRLSNNALKVMAVVGPHAVSQRALLGDYYGDAFCAGNNTPGHAVDSCVPTLGASIADVCASPRPDVEVLIAEGVSFVGNDTSGVAAALAAVEQANVVVLAVGYSNQNVRFLHAPAVTPRLK